MDFSAASLRHFVRALALCASGGMACAGANAAASDPLASPAPSAPATTRYVLTVDTTADTVAADGKCSLREAIAIVSGVFDANNDCPLVASGNPSDSIGFDATLQGTTITLSSNTALAVGATAFVTIDGPSPSLASSVTLDGNNATRIFDIAAGANVSLQHMTLQHGKTTSSSPDGDGGGVRNAGTLSIDNCTLRLNTSGGGGGGIANEGSLTLTATTLTNNSANSGGGLLDRNLLSILHGYISNNNAVAQGGGLDLRSQSATIGYTTVQNNGAGSGSGGIYLASNGSLTLSGSLLAGNHVTGTGGGIGNFGQLSVSNSTFSGNSASSFGGGISNDPAVAVTTTIVAATFGGNTSGGGNAIANLQGGISLRHSLLGGSGNCVGTVTDAGGNIATDASCALGAGSLSTTDPQLSPLAYYGGPTWTMPPSASSPALDVIDAAQCDGATDERGTPRPQGGKCDVGAVELETDRIFLDGFDFWP